MSGGSHPIVFAELLEELRREGFAVGTGHYLRLQQLLPHVVELSPVELRTVLCPLFARNPDEQARFYRAYDEFLARTTVSVAPVSVRIAARAREGLHRAPSRKAIVRAAIGTFALLGALALWIYIRHPRQAGGGENAAQLTTTVTTIATTTEAVPANTKREGAAAAPLAKTPLVLWAGRAATDHPMAILAGALALLLLLELARSIKREWYQRRNRGRGRPFVWPLRGDDASRELFTSAEFRDAARLLREREGSGHERLDLRRTVQATARAAGDLVPIYKESRRQPEYLLLIERRGGQDHLKAYYESLAVALVREGVVVERYDVESDPRTARLPGSDEHISTTELHARYPDHRLLVCASTAHGLLDPLSGEAVEWVNAALPWAQRGLLVADAHTGNSRALRRLGLAIGEATAHGLRAVAEQWNGQEERRHRMPTLAPPPLDESLEEIRESVTPETWELLVRCAAHATVEWPLTCALLPPSWSPTAVERVLLELSRLGWFRRGAIPQAVRQQLLRELESDAERVAVRETVVRVLGHGDPPAESTAARLREVAVESQRLWLHRASRRVFHRDARRLRRYPLVMIYADAPLLALLRSAPATRFWHRVSVPVRRIFFPSAAPALGYRSFLAVPLLSLLLIGALLRSGDPRPDLSGGSGGGGGAVGDLDAAGPRPETPLRTITSVTSTDTTIANAPSTDLPGGDPTTFAAGTVTTPAAAETATMPVLSETAVRPALDFSPAALRALALDGAASGTGGAPVETAAPAPGIDPRLAAGLPVPDLIEPIGRIELVTGRNSPVVFEWAPFGAYELVIWKGSTSGPPIFQTTARGNGYSWFPEAPLDPLATYSWTLRGAMVPRALTPEVFMAAYVDASDLIVTSSEEQERRSRKVAKKVVFDIPCGTSSKGTRSVRFNLRNREEILHATTRLTAHAQLAAGPEVSDPLGKGGVVAFDYNFAAAPAGSCTQSARAEVTVIATLGPHKEEPAHAGGGGGGAGAAPAKKKDGQ